MTKSEELIQAAQMLKESCKEAIVKLGPDRRAHCCLPNGQICPFDKPQDCKIANNYEPGNWDLPKPRRFTDTDILWAKAAKASGGEDILRYDAYSIYTRGRAAMPGQWRDVARLPADSFKGIKPGESVPIDEILKEADQ